MRKHVRATSEPHPNHIRTASEPHPNRIRTASEPHPNRIRTGSSKKMSEVKVVGLRNKNRKRETQRKQFKTIQNNSAKRRVLENSPWELPVL